MFDRYNIVSEQDLTDAVRKLQKFQDAADPFSSPGILGRVSPASFGELGCVSF